MLVIPTSYLFASIEKQDISPLQVCSLLLLLVGLWTRSHGQRKGYLKMKPPPHLQVLASHAIDWEVTGDTGRKEMAPERTNDPGEVGRPSLCPSLRLKVPEVLGPQVVVPRVRREGARCFWRD